MKIPTGWRFAITLLLTVFCGSIHSAVAMAPTWTSKTVGKPGTSTPTIRATEQIRLGLDFRRALRKISAAGAAKSVPPTRPYKSHAPHPTAAQARLQAAKRWRISWNRDNGTPAFIDGMMRGTAKRSVIPTAEAAVEFLAHKNFLFGLRDPTNELRLRHNHRDADGAEHLVFDQFHGNTPLWGHDLVVHFDARGQLYAVNGRYAPSPTIELRPPEINIGEAIDIATQHLAQHTERAEFSPQLQRLLGYTGPKTTLSLWLNEQTDTYHLIWQILLRPNIRDRWQYFIDADSGAILEYYNATHHNGPATAWATDLDGSQQKVHSFEYEGDYYLIDASRAIYLIQQVDPIDNPVGAVWTMDARNQDLGFGNSLHQVISADNIWNDPVAVSAHVNTGRVFDYFFQVHGRRGIDDLDGSLISVIHVTEAGRPMDNAFWNGAFMAYGDGNSLFEPLAGALDVIAHEMTHGVIERTVPLEYRYQSGALNESLADVFAAMIDREDWLIAEDVVRPSAFPSGALRNMANPHNGGSKRSSYSQPDHMDEFVHLDIRQDNAGVHINSGIPNRACVLLAKVIGRQRTEKIYYRVLDARYLNSRSRFSDMRRAARRAAAELYGEDGIEVSAVEQAFDAVGIVNAEPTRAPADIMPVAGEQWILATNIQSLEYSLFLIRPEGPTNKVIPLTNTPTYDRSGNSITVSDDGTILFFVDDRNFIRALHTDGSGEEVVSENGEWSSIALAPRGDRLAATRVLEDSTIYIFDLHEPQRSKSIKLYNPTTQEGVKARVTLFADAMDWDQSGQFLLYDAFNRVAQHSGEAIEFWNVNLLDVDNELVFPVFPALPEGISIGNPSFAQTNDNYFAFERIDKSRGKVELWTADRFTGTASHIADNGNSLGFPKWAPDDSYLIFQRFDPERNLLDAFRLPLQDDRLAARGQAERFISAVRLPVWFTIGQRPDPPTQIRNAVFPPNATFFLQNHPNPFNAATTINYHLPIGGMIELTIYDLLGGRVAQLSRGYHGAGDHKVHWHGNNDRGQAVASGVYFCRLDLENNHSNPTLHNHKMILLR